MAGLNKNQKDKYNKIFTDCWKLLTDHGDPKTEQDWEEWIQLVGEISVKHKSKFADDMLRKMTDEIERRWRDEKRV